MERSKVIFNIWLETKSRENEIQALATALKMVKIDVESSLLEIGCREKLGILDNTSRYSYEFEGVGKDFPKMIEPPKRGHPILLQ